MRLRIPLAAIVLMLAAVPGARAQAPAGSVRLVSRPSGFGPLTTPFANDSNTSDASGDRLVSDAGAQRYVVFVSSADGLSSEDDDSVSNVYVRDRVAATTTLVSRASGPVGANGASSEPSISADGRWVAFESLATNLASGASDGSSHVYLRDLQAGTTQLVDRAANVANDQSSNPSVAVTGGHPVVAFASRATNLDGVTGGHLQVYVRELGATPTTEMVSREDGSATAAGNGNSADPSISADGSRIAFESSATNLLGAGVDSNGHDDVFVRTPASDVTAIASFPSNGDSTDPSISDNGNLVAFVSDATTLPDDSGGAGDDVYVTNLSGGTTVLASRASGNGAVGDQRSDSPSLSGDGSAVAFASASANLGPDANASSDVFVRANVFGGAAAATTLVSRPAAGVVADGVSVRPSIAHGTTAASSSRLVAFATGADNMGAQDDNDFGQVYARAVGALAAPNAASLISRPTGSAAFASGVNDSILVNDDRSLENAETMSADGRYALFRSDEDDLSSVDDNRATNIFRRDNLTGATVLVNRADGINGAAEPAALTFPLLGAFPFGLPVISADGNRVAWTSSSAGLVAGDNNGAADVFVRDIAAGTTTIASRRPDGSLIPASSGDPAISGDGKRVAFVTGYAMDGDAGTFSDVYLRDLAAGTTRLISRKGAAGASGNEDSSSPTVDADGTHVAFATYATDLGAVTDTNAKTDIFVRDAGAGTTTPVSVDAGGGAMGDDASGSPAISGDGRRVAFQSNAADLVAAGQDVNVAVSDVFVRDVVAAKTLLVSRPAAAAASGNSGSIRPAIDAGGTRIAFETRATDLFGGDVNGQPDVVLRDTAAGTTELVSRAQGVAGAQASDGSTPSISADGDCVAFATHSDALVAMPPGTDFSRIVARTVRGDCPFGPVATVPPPGGGPGPGADTTAPVVTGARIRPRRFLAGRRLRKRTATRPAVGGRLRFTLSEAAAVELRFARLRSGRRLRGRCVVPRRAPGGRRCTRVSSRGRLARAGVAGANRVAVTGRLRGRKLAAGNYRITLVATDAAGNAATPVRVRFTVLRAP